MSIEPVEAVVVAELALQTMQYIILSSKLDHYIIAATFRLRNDIIFRSILRRLKPAATDWISACAGMTD